MDLTTITVADFKSQFPRGFPYQPSGDPVDQDLYVQDSDIQAAFNEAQIVFNQSLFSSNEKIELGYLYLTAHYLTHDLRAANSGIQGRGDFPVTSRSVGSVSESYGVPESYTKDPILSFYTNTHYGMKYLSLLLPALVGNKAAVAGGTRP